MLEEPKYVLIMIKSLSILVLFSVILITGNIPLMSKSFTENKVSSQTYFSFSPRFRQPFREDYF